MVRVRLVSPLTVIVIGSDEAAEYVPSPASSARIVHEPVRAASAVKVDPEIEQ